MQQINIKNEKTIRLAKEVSAMAGENITEAITHALQNRLEGLRKKKLNSRKGVARKILAAAQEFQKMPVLDERNADHILYDEHGLPKRLDS